jgi:hypothetical protein
VPNLDGNDILIEVQGRDRVAGFMHGLLAPEVHHARR